MKGRGNRGGTVIPGWSAGPDPESRDSGFVASATPRNDGWEGRRSRRDRPDRLRLRLLPGPAQFVGDFGVQHLFQPGQGRCDQGGVGNAVIPADHDIDGLVWFDHPITEDKRTWTERMQLAGAIGGNRSYSKTSAPVGALASEIEPNQPHEAAKRQRQPCYPQHLAKRRYLADRGVLGMTDLRIDFDQRYRVRRRDFLRQNAILSIFDARDRHHRNAAW